MRKSIFFLITCFLLFAFSASALASTKYVVNDVPITDMSIEDLYNLEDAVKNAINEVFAATSVVNESGEIIGTYVINTKNNKFHYPYCLSALQLGTNRSFVFCTAAQLYNQGYTPCGQCNPYAKQP